MNPMLKVSAAVLLAAMSALPALAAVNATVMTGAKADIVPIVTLDGMVGKWGQPELDALGKASSVTVFDASKLYSATDLKLLGQADTANSVNLVKLRSAIDANADLKAWFDKNHIDVTHVIAISDTGGKVNVYTF
ncbi:MAG: hypothetical protein EOP22_17155 [Hyphomicrobiales bacterium]|nr:MAG: hypothetical protein EOP22_17155 [Hyphomicrobiales bacterium]